MLLKSFTSPVQHGAPHHVCIACNLEPALVLSWRRVVVVLLIWASVHSFAIARDRLDRKGSGLLSNRLVPSFRRRLQQPPRARPRHCSKVPTPCSNPPSLANTASPMHQGGKALTVIGFGALMGKALCRPSQPQGWLALLMGIMSPLTVAPRGPRI